MVGAAVNKDGEVGMVDREMGWVVWDGLRV